jgi:hypothetical protein
MRKLFQKKETIILILIKERVRVLLMARVGIPWMQTVGIL